MSDGELAITLETIVTVETLIGLAEPPSRKYNFIIFDACCVNICFIAILLLSLIIRRFDAR